MPNPYVILSREVIASVSLAILGVRSFGMIWIRISDLRYCKILKISPSNYKPPRGLYLENCHQIQSKTKKNGKFTSNYKARPIDFETQISLRR